MFRHPKEGRESCRPDAPEMECTGRMLDACGGQDRGNGFSPSQIRNLHVGSWKSCIFGLRYRMYLLHTPSRRAVPPAYGVKNLERRSLALAHLTWSATFYQVAFCLSRAGFQGSQ